MNLQVQMLFRIKTLFALLVLVSIVSCHENAQSSDFQLYRFRGLAQGTSYTIQVYDSVIHFDQQQIDALLLDFDKKLSTYKSTSLISRFNQNTFQDTLLAVDDIFVEMLTLSDSVFQITDGYFDPSIKPIMDLWDIGSGTKTVPNQGDIDSVLAHVGFAKGLHFDYILNDRQVLVTKDTPDFQLDFNAIAQGYSIDILLDFLKSKGHQNLYVELGGELKLSGHKQNGENWRIGVEAPNVNNTTSNQSIQSVFSISDCAMATSGNYRKYFEADGTFYAHTMNPKSGIQNRHGLLSATVVSNSCALSDALATYFMVVGMQQSLSFLERNVNLDVEVYFIYADKGVFKSFCSDGLKTQKETTNS